MDAGSVSTSSAISTAIQGLQKNQAQIEQTAQNIASGSLDPQDVVSLSQAATSFKANAAVIRTDNEMTQSLLNITA
jgi:flagellar hook-associated protein FlgK